MPRRSVLGTLAASSLALAGCPLSVPISETERGATEASAVGLPATADSASNDPLTALLERVGETLTTELQTRGLSTSIHGAWQIFHGILAFGDAFEIDTPIGRQGALAYFVAGGQCRGFQPRVGDRFEPEDRRGLQVDIEPRTKVGQGHRDQWLAVVAQAGLPIDAEWRVEQRRFRIADWLRQAEWDVPLNYEAEFSWTLIPLSIYRPSDHRFVARDGQTYSTELLLENEVLQDLSASVCGGTHRLIGIAFAVRRRQSEGGPMVGVWNDAQQRLSGAIELARINQNPDGSYGPAYFHRSGWCRDLGQALGTTGHVLEFLALAADLRTLRSPWVRRIVDRLCVILQQCRDVDLECGVLYHALHGLVEYCRRCSE